MKNVIAQSTGDKAISILSMGDCFASLAKTCFKLDTVVFPRIIGRVILFEQLYIFPFLIVRPARVRTQFPSTPRRQHFAHWLEFHPQIHVGDALRTIGTTPAAVRRRCIRFGSCLTVVRRFAIRISIPATAGWSLLRRQGQKPSCGSSRVSIRTKPSSAAKSRRSRAHVPILLPAIGSSPRGDGRLHTPKDSNPRDGRAH